MEGNSPLLVGSEGSPDIGAAGGSTFMVKVVLPKERVFQAVKILKENGGQV